MPVYGSTWAHYGTKACSICKKVHLDTKTIKESSKSRFKLMQVLMEVRLSSAWTGASDNEDRMFGLLITPQKTFATHSGDLKGGNTPFLKAALAKGHTLALTQEEKAGGNHTGLGGPIKPHIYQSAKVGGAYKPGNCAAPRLVEAAIEDGTVTKDPSLWAMSEVMYNPSGSNQQWWHGLTAHSCATCDKLVPMLLCS